MEFKFLYYLNFDFLNQVKISINKIEEITYEYKEQQITFDTIYPLESIYNLFYFLSNIDNNNIENLIKKWIQD